MIHRNAQFALLVIMMNSLFSIRLQVKKIDTHQNILTFPNETILLVLIVFMFLIALLIFLYMKIHQKMKHQQTYDSLCNCLNLSTFKNKVSLYLEKTNLDKAYIIFFDIDNFSYINHYYDHSTGKQVLIKLTSFLQERIHESGLLAHIANDEFILFIHTKDNVVKVFDNCIETITSTFNLNIPLSLKLGIYEVFDSNENIDKMIEKAMLAKENIEEEKNYHYYSYEIDKLYREIGEIEINKEYALNNHEFHLYFQPKIDLESEKIVGAEALIRWIKPDGTIIYPNVFIPIFEKNNFIKKLDLYTFKEVCKIFQSINFSFPISINQSRCLLNDDYYLNNLTQILNKYPIDPNKLEIEVTESMDLRDEDKLIEVTTMLRDLNFSISMDDFGSGYSSLKLLAKLPIQIVKIDKSVLDAESSTTSQGTLMKNIINMAHELNMKVVCEGTETQEQCAMLKRLHCDMAQGYYFSRPINLEDFLVFTKQNLKESY